MLGRLFGVLGSLWLHLTLLPFLAALFALTLLVVVLLLLVSSWPTSPRTVRMPIPPGVGRHLAKLLLVDLVPGVSPPVASGFPIS